MTKPNSDNPDGLAVAPKTLVAKHQKLHKARNYRALVYNYTKAGSL